jgi:hypothetical protein
MSELLNQAMRGEIVSEAKTCAGGPAGPCPTPVEAGPVEECLNRTLGELNELYEGINCLARKLFGANVTLWPNFENMPDTVQGKANSLHSVACNLRKAVWQIDESL